MNSFDIVVYLALVIAVVAGFRAGLLRSAITILAYLIAMPIAVWIMSLLAPAIGGGDAPLTQNSVLFFGIFLASGMALGWLARMALDDAIGAGDRIWGSSRRRRAWRRARRAGGDHAGADLRSTGAGRRQPAWLVGSQLRPCCRWPAKKASARCRRKSPPISTG